MKNWLTNFFFYWILAPIVMIWSYISDFIEDKWVPVLGLLVLGIVFYTGILVGRSQSPEYCESKAVQGCEIVLGVAMIDKEEVEMQRWRCEAEKHMLVRSNEAYKMTIDCLLRPGDCRSPTVEEHESENSPK